MSQTIVVKIKEIKEVFELNRQSAAVQMIWDAFKAYIREFIGQKNKNKGKKDKNC